MSRTEFFYNVTVHHHTSRTTSTNLNIYFYIVHCSCVSTKLNGIKLNGTMLPVIFFFVHCSCISMKNKNITYCFFFRAIHHIDPLHRKQTLILPLAILGISRTAPTETSRRARNVQDICLPTVFPAYKMHLVSPFTSEPRKVVKRQRAACFVLHHRRQTMLVSSCSRETENTIECKEFVLRLQNSEHNC